MEKVNRTIYLKKVECFTRKKNFSPDPIDVVLRKVLKKLTTSEQRHKPTLKDAKNDEVCHFVNRTHWLKDTKKFIGLEICTYVKGYVPAQFVSNFSKSELPITTEKIIGKDGVEREVAFISYIVAKGESVAIQLPRGSGGISELEQYLTWLIRNSGITEYKDYPCIHLLDVLGKDFEQTLKAGGGAVQMTVHMANTGEKKGFFSNPLQKVAKAIGGSSQISVALKGKNKLTDKDVIKLYKSDDDFDGITITLKKGGVITTGAYKVKSIVNVESKNGNPVFSQILQELSGFVTNQMEFQTIGKKKVRLLDNDGKFV